MPKSKHRKGFKKRKAQKRKKQLQTKKQLEHKLTKIYQKQYEEIVRKELEERGEMSKEIVQKSEESASLIENTMSTYNPFEEDED